MGDSSHLERMGRELKCPICLSLLDSAISLTCNHVFCNGCIHKSMKSGSNCPVCKVPYQRREIRPAPHMDSLVNIYKSMEVASGLSLFISQNPPAIRSSGKPNEGDLNAKSSEETPETVKIQRVKGVRAKTPSRPKSKASTRNRRKSSFPTNKRVQVPESPTSETPIREALCHSEKVRTINDIDGKSSDLPDVHPPSTGSEIPFLPPFFWLREDEDKPSQHTDEDDLTGTPVKAPSFSDIMDSDDDVPSNSSPKEETLRKCNNGSLFDSEMFEWTQRPCSPELFSTPVKIQGAVGSSCKLDGMDEDVMAPSISNTKVVTEYLDNLNTFEKSGDGDHEFQNEPSGSKRPRKRSEMGKKSKILKRKEITAQVKDAYHGSETRDGSIQMPECNPDCTTKNDDAVVSELDAFSNGKRGPRKDSKRKYGKINQSHTIGTQKHKKQKCTSAISDKIEAEIRAEDEKQDTVSKSSSTIAEAKDVDGTSKGENRGTSLRIGKVDFQKDMPLLQKHNATTPYKCAFCHSAEETEASGEMVHYCDGRPVPEDHKPGPVIHSHKNCTEWAPNVYFEDDNVVNLEEELARSRRIKCSLCGERGAALGCYEKSCRKSFHVPCAKLLQNCRWDNDHFVILCSLHASSKLPCELSTSQVKKERSYRKFHHQQSQVAVARCLHKNTWKSSQKLVFCCSGLAYAEKEIVSEFAKLSGTVISTRWDPSVTHVIASIDENEACKRTIKVLMGILEGKWIVSVKWVQACMKEKKLVDETPYEINHDVHGVKDGPSRGRSRLQNKERKLFAGFKFYFRGDFAPSYKGYLQDLVTAAGGIILHRKPLPEAVSSAASKPIITTIIVYNIELPESSDLSNKDTILERRRLDAEALARSSGCTVANSSWILNSVAGHKLQDL